MSVAMTLATWVPAFAGTTHLGSVNTASDTPSPGSIPGRMLSYWNG